MLRLGALRGQQACLSSIGPKRTWCDRLPFSLLDHRDHLDLNHCLWLSETADLDRRAGRTGYAQVAPAALRQASRFLKVCSSCARMSPGPTMLPSASRASWPAM